MFEAKLFCDFYYDEASGERCAAVVKNSCRLTGSEEQLQFLLQLGTHLRPRLPDTRKKTVANADCNCKC